MIQVVKDLNLKHNRQKQPLEVLIKKVKFHRIHRKIHVLETLFNKVDIVFGFLFTLLNK